MGEMDRHFFLLLLLLLLLNFFASYLYFYNVNFLANPARQNGDFGRKFSYFQLIFRLFSTYPTPSAIFPPTCLRKLNFNTFKLY